MSSSPTSRCVTARSTSGGSSPRGRRPARRAAQSPPRFDSGATSIWTKFVSVAVGIDREARLGEPEREPLRAARGRRRAGRRGDRARRRRPRRRSPPGASRRRKVLQPAGVPHHLGRAGEHGAERAAEPLREAERDGVEAAADRRGVDPRSRPRRSAAARRRGGSEARARRASRAQLVDLVERPDAARRSRCACSRPRRRACAASGSPGPGRRHAPARRVKRPATPGQPARDDARVDRRPAELGDEDVRSSPRRAARRRAPCAGAARSGSPSSRSGGRSPRPGRAAPPRAPRAR